MADERIMVKIDAEGAISLETFGIKGEDCIDEILSVLENMTDVVEDIKFTKEYKEKSFSQKTKLHSDNKLKLGEGKK